MSSDGILHLVFRKDVFFGQYSSNFLDKIVGNAIAKVKPSVISLIKNANHKITLYCVTFLLDDLAFLLLVLQMKL